LFNLKKMGKVNTSIGQTLAVKPGLPTLTPSLVLNPTLTPRAPTLSQTLSPPSSPHVPNQVDQDTVDLLKQQFIALDADGSGKSRHIYAWHTPGMHTACV